MPKPYVYSQIYRGRLLSKDAFARLVTLESPSREWFTHINDKYTILHAPGCNRTLNLEGDLEYEEATLNDTIISNVPWSYIRSKIGTSILEPLVNISSDDFSQLRTYLNHAVKPNEKDGIYILQSQLDHVGHINSMKILRNVRVNVDFYMNFGPVYDMRRRSIDNENRPYLLEA